MTTTSTLMFSLVTAVALGAGLAGCTSASSTVDRGPSVTTSTTTAPSAGGPSPAGSDSTAAGPADDTCVDGFAWMQFGDGEPRSKTLPDGCDTVIVNGSDAELTLGPTRVVVVMGDRNTVDVPHVDQVDAMGDDNTIRLDHDPQPVLNTDGTGNVVTTR